MAQLVDMPFELGKPGEEEREEQPQEGGIPDYRDPHVVCANCRHFDGDTRCEKYNAPADMDGSCPSFEEGAADEAAEEGIEGSADTTGEPAGFD